MTDVDPATRTVVFTGRIHPERAAVELRIIGGEGDGSLDLMFGQDPTSLSHARVRIEASQVTVTVEWHGEDLLTLRNITQDVVASLVDAIGWTNGCGYVAEISSYAAGETQGVFGVQVPVLASKGSRVDAGAIYGLIIAGPAGIHLRRALADQRSAILTPGDTPFFCYRAVESLQRDFGRRTAGRNGLCRALRIDSGWIDAWLKDPADELRHGASLAVTDEDRQRAFMACHEVIERFMVLRSTGVSTLPAEAFPMLRRADDPLLLRAPAEAGG